MPPPSSSTPSRITHHHRGSNKKHNSKLQVRRISIIHAALLCLTCAIMAFYVGMMVGTAYTTNATTSLSSFGGIQQQTSLLDAAQKISSDESSSLTSSSNQKKTREQLEQQVLHQQRVIYDQQKRAAAAVMAGATTATTDDRQPRFPKTVSDMIIGAGRVHRDDFTQRFDMGVPLDPTSPQTNSEVLLLYASEQALPVRSNPYAAAEAQAQTTAPLLTAEAATENCDFLHVILTDHSRKRRQCLALLGQYEAFHIQKWMRLPENGLSGKLNESLPLTLVNRGAQASGRRSTRVPSYNTTLQYWSVLQTYLSSRESVLEQLRPIAERVAVNNTIIVLVCNQGQSELLLNFICSAKRRGLELRGILVFATDQETKDLILALNDPNIGVFMDEINFGDMPKKAARRYADATFMHMMMAKVFCVQMISSLGYDLLFQDVDVIWYKNPLSYFHNPNAPDAHFDVYFQDDGNHALFYAPYSANTGFYYVRHNERTQYFFNAFLMAGDLIIGTRSHQIPLVALLQEHASMYALRVKIFSRDTDTFPGGHAFHRRKDFMKDLIAAVKHVDEQKAKGIGTTSSFENHSLIKPYIFHMSWTNNKVNKRKFFQQMGEWYLQNECIDKTVQALGIDPTAAAATSENGESPLVSKCCAAEPLITCHYRDKPSKIPCPDSPPIDKGHGSFWK